jgi:hypothetical protein
MKRHQNDVPALASLSGNERVELAAQSLTSETFEATLKSPRTVTFHRFYWPAWRLYSNGQELKTWPDSIGRATADLPAGNYEAIWKLERSPLEQAGLWVSVLTVAGIIAIMAAGRVRRRGMAKGAQP